MLAPARSDIGDPVLRLALPLDWLTLLELNPRVAFLLSRLDGRSALNELLPGCGLHREEAMEALAELIDEGVVEARNPYRLGRTAMGG